MAHVFRLGISVAMGTLLRLDSGLPASGGAGQPFLVPLRRELYPVRRDGQVVSFKTSYSGIIHLGQPTPQEFRVVFDTGSGHIVLPSVECTSVTCKKHRRFDAGASKTAWPINLDGLAVQGRPDKVTIGFGTGRIVGKFVRERVCLGSAAFDPLANSAHGGPCAETNVVMAIDMSQKPFELFDFDGILGLGLHSLSLNKNFSFSNLLVSGSKIASPQFGVLLSEGDGGEESEIAFGGYNPRHMASPLAWVPMAKPELGYWQVAILSVSIGGKRMEACGDGSCYGVLDSGTSHLGLPASLSPTVNDLLTRPAGDTQDCRVVRAPRLDIELQGVTLTLHPRTYMRRLPVSEELRADMSSSMLESSFLSKSAPTNSSCTPKLLSVNLPSLGKNAFILGEPVLHRYYTVFDWAKLQAGFAVRALHEPQQQPGPAGGSSDHEEVQDALVLLEHGALMSTRRGDVKDSTHAHLAKEAAKPPEAG
mmetsp:Transcript_46377/g.107114  ORF Transcript_46377/g.107114 Transcript_46377/m.107114 type:complete len:478 (+) Transcript_46377:107-1540(+)